MTTPARKVLLVDDDPHIRQLLAFAFGKAGMATIEAGDGEEALARITAETPDLLVLDINMPRMDGLEVCRRLRGMDSAVPILFLSSRDDEIDRVLGIELGADDYVVKPFSPREVVARAGRS
jgi:two-component system OmpR family response regulator